MASTKLTNTQNLKANDKFIADLTRKEPERWRETALLAAAKAARGSASSIWLFVDALCYLDHDDPDASIEDTWGALIAGRALSESAILKPLSPANLRKMNRIKQWLVRILSGDELSAHDRVVSGKALSQLGDPRFNPEKWYLPDDEDLGFVKIPAGPFLMGTPENENSEFKEQIQKARDDGRIDETQFKYLIGWLNAESPQHEIELPEFMVAKYPVTVSQFRLFVDETGYDAGKEWLRDPENHPVRYVSWHDATAYCEWLTQKVEDRGWKITLPTEAQWEKTARGTEGRVYAYGDKPDAGKMNCNETGIGTTSAVGCFSQGKSSYGVFDMSGNVWEWTNSLWGSDPFETEFRYPYDPNDGREDMSGRALRVLRGGSWNGGAGDCRSADRDGGAPGSRLDCIGFRLFCLPGHP